LLVGGAFFVFVSGNLFYDQINYVSLNYCYCFCNCVPKSQKNVKETVTIAQKLVCEWLVLLLLVVGGQRQIQEARALIA